MRRILLGVLIGLAASAAAVAEDKVEIDNTWVRVVRIGQTPGGQSLVHGQFASVVVYLTDAKEKVVGANGKSQEIQRKTGDVAWFDAGKFPGENVSGKPFEAIVVELKPGAPKSPPITLDSVKLEPKRHTVPIENAQVRVLHTILEPQLKQPLHEHPHYIVVYLTDLHTSQTLADGKTVDNLRKRGEVGWREAVKHQAVNVGDKRGEEIQIELK